MHNRHDREHDDSKGKDLGLHIYVHPSGGVLDMYQLSLRQAPSQGKACPPRDSHRRSLEQMPVVTLKRHDGDTTFQYTVSPHYVCCVELYTVGPESRNCTKILNGNRNSTGHRLRNQEGELDTKGEDVTNFIFPELYVAEPGRYKLRFWLREMCTSSVPGEEQGGAVVLQAIESPSFEVFDAKNYPGAQDSSPLTRRFFDQGCSKSIKMRSQSTRAGRKRHRSAYEPPPTYRAPNSPHRYGQPPSSLSYQQHPRQQSFPYSIHARPQEQLYTSGNAWQNARQDLQPPARVSYRDEREQSIHGQYQTVDAYARTSSQYTQGTQQQVSNYPVSTYQQHPQHTQYAPTLATNTSSLSQHNEGGPQSYTLPPLLTDTRATMSQQPSYSNTWSRSGSGSSRSSEVGPHGTEHSLSTYGSPSQQLYDTYRRRNSDREIPRTEHLPMSALTDAGNFADPYSSQAPLRPFLPPATLDPRVETSVATTRSGANLGAYQMSSGSSPIMAPMPPPPGSTQQRPAHPTMSSRPLGPMELLSRPFEHQSSGEDSTSDHVFPRSGALPWPSEHRRFGQ